MPLIVPRSTGLKAGSGGTGLFAGSGGLGVPGRDPLPDPLVGLSFVSEPHDDGDGFTTADISGLPDGQMMIAFCAACEGGASFNWPDDEIAGWSKLIEVTPVDHGQIIGYFAVHVRRKQPGDTSFTFQTKTNGGLIHIVSVPDALAVTGVDSWFVDGGAVTLPAFSSGPVVWWTCRLNTAVESLFTSIPGFTAVDTASSTPGAADVSAAVLLADAGGGAGIVSAVTDPDDTYGPCSFGVRLA